MVKIANAYPADDAQIFPNNFLPSKISKWLTLDRTDRETDM